MKYIIQVRKGNDSVGYVKDDGPFTDNIKEAKRFETIGKAEEVRYIISTTFQIDTWIMLVE